MYYDVDEGVTKECDTSEFEGAPHFYISAGPYNGGAGTGDDLASAYFIFFHKERGVTWLMGENGNMNFGEPRLETVTQIDPQTGEFLSRFGNLPRSGFITDSGVLD